jgi:23S rRNA G2069 N7-methylase RlmK/C1962 C5-methylase RlmI
LQNLIQEEDQEDNRWNPIGYRLINAENDFLPGLIVDRYSHYLVLQALTLGIDQRKQMIAEQLASLLKIKGIYERSDVDVRGKEGLSFKAGVLWGEEPPDLIDIYEGRVQIKVDVRKGHKTGYYLDQAVTIVIPLGIYSICLAILVGSASTPLAGITSTPLQWTPPKKPCN